ncbi:TetR/AcrR family transcriptional regulator [Shouchella patagoniensis]|uniref:TetR/AcrR family transcriptional regulator n=1 Tax=Shouchella patagoniensis TaxID=228576 RepID=UPI000995827B|nr:TetR/AcrR family transcriptional regulator [Shouchella patagoniensis]
MRKKDLEKEKEILVTAKNLFSSKSYKGTSMQTIAETCGISKGTLYLYFKSKEELLISILEYYFRYIEDQIIAIEADTVLSQKEKLANQLKIVINHYIENQEFYRVQDQEMRHLENKQLYRQMQSKSTINFNWVEQSLLKIYGDSIKPYVTDGAFTLIGITRQYMELVVMHQLPADLDQVIRYCIDQVDIVLKNLPHSSYPPFMNNHLRSLYLDEDPEERLNPLEITKQMKADLKQGQLDEVKEEALQTLAILEKELMNLKPNPIIIKGMVRNLRATKRQLNLLDKLIESLHIKF